MVIMKSLRTLALTILSVIGAAGIFVIPAPAQAARLVGRVVDWLSATVFANATIAIRRLSVVTNTDERGFFYAENVAAGTYLAEIVLADGRRFLARIRVLPNQQTSFAEIDFSRVVPPDDDEY